MDVAGKGDAATGGKKEHHMLYRYGLIHDWSPDTRDEYQNTFTNDKIRLGEFTPFYLRASWICELTAEALPDDAPIIVLVRDPIDRFASAIRHEMTVATRRYRKYLKATGKIKRRLMDMAALGRRGARQEAIVEMIRGNAQSPAEMFRDATWLRFVGSDASWGGMYAAQLAAWTAVLPADRFIVIQYEKLREDPQRYADLIWRRLGLEPVSMTGVDLRSRGSTNSTKWLPEDHPHVVRALQQMYRSDAKRLADQFDIDLALWKRTMTDA
jgi:hypothetical protein